MAKDGVGGFESRELAAQWFTGFRAWRIPDHEAPALHSATHDYTWAPGVNTAACDPLSKTLICEKRDDHIHAYEPGKGCYVRNYCRGVALYCGCGFWAYDTPTNWFKTGSTGTNAFTVTGVIHGFGRMVIGTKGFRAEKAVIAALVMPPQYVIPTPWRWLGHAVKPEVDEERMAETRATRDAQAEQIEALLREQYPLVPFFRNVEDMLATVQLTPLKNLIDPEDAA